MPLDSNISYVMLTGGLGFIGSHTAVELLRSGWNVVIADNLSNSELIVADRIARISGRSPELEIVDVCNRTDVYRIFNKYHIDSVIHFAGYKAVGESVKQPLKYYHNNIDATLTLLEVMKEFACEKMIFSSSATVYGDKQSAPFNEEMEVGSCTNPYGRTKFFIEEILRDHVISTPEFSATLLRYFNPVGAHPSGLLGEKPNGIPNNLMPYIAQTAAGIRPYLTIYGNDYDTFDGTGVRDYIHVTDLAIGHVKALEYSFNHCGCHVFNLGTGNGSSVLEVLHAFESAVGREIPYRIADRRPGDIAISYADASKAERVLGWKATRNLFDMCRDSWNFQNHYEEFRKVK